MNPLAAPQTSTLSPRNGLLFLLTCLFAVLVVVGAVYQLKAPAAVAANTAPAEFASGRAMEHLKVIASQPHPTGSQALDNVRAYIVRQLAEQGLTAEVQNSVVVSKSPNRTTAVNVNNVLARLEGTGTNGKALMLTAHYDSAPTSLGASDNGAGVATLLETLRALKAGTPLKNDVVFLFTDGEELGLKGAEAFVKGHPWAKEIGLVLNFEARGTAGPVYMFETSVQNGELIEQFGDAVPHPVASSQMDAIYRQLPNDTDMTVFKRAGMAGLNFAFIDGFSNYHTPLDDVNRLDERSLQHHGSYALALARHFGNTSPEVERSSDAVYFDILGATFISYSTVWVWPLTLLALLLFAAVIIYGLRRKRLKLTGMALGLLALILSVIVSTFFVTVLWSVVSKLQGSGNPTSSGAGALYLAGLAALVVAITAAIYLYFAKYVDLDSMSVGGLLGWVIILAVVTVILPAATHLFLWPLVFGLAAMWVRFARPVSAPALQWFVVLCVCTLPALILLPAAIYSVFQGLAFQALSPLIALIVLLLGLLVLYLTLLPLRYRWTLSGVALLACVVLLGAGYAMSARQGTPYRFNTVAYFLDADSGEAFWGTVNPAQDQWTSQFFGGAPEKKPLVNLNPNSNVALVVEKAPVVTLPPDEFQVLNDSNANGIRTIRMKITTPRGARTLKVFVEPVAEVLAATVNGSRLEYGGNVAADGRVRWWELNFIGVPGEGIDLTLETKPFEQAKVKVVSQSDQFPDVSPMAIKPRPSHLLPSPNSDTTSVSRTFTLGGG